MVKESIPKEGENIKIQSYKHDGNIHRVWSETTILKGTEHVFIIIVIYLRLLHVTKKR